MNKAIETGTVWGSSGTCTGVLLLLAVPHCGFDLARFLDSDAYRPLPTLVRAARALFQHNPLPTTKRAAAATDPGRPPAT